MSRVNLQPAEGLDRQADGSLDVIKVWRTIQGEGPFAGRPAVFVRLAGCNLDCPGCDTEYTTGRIRHDWKEVVADVVSESRRSLPAFVTDFVVLTGGEPFRQNVYPLMEHLIDKCGIVVQVETNGSLAVPVRKSGYEEIFLGAHKDGMLQIVCSPKVQKVHRDLLPHVAAFKYVVEADKVDPADGLPTSVLGNECRVARPWDWLKEIGDNGYNRANNIFVQPMDPGWLSPEIIDREDYDKVYGANLKQAVDSCMKFGYRLSIQQHKVAGLE